MQRTNYFTLLLFVMFLLGVSFLAYLKLIPTEIKAIPFYDSIGHFVLFGMLGLIAHYAFNQKRVTVFRLAIPLGPLLAVTYACIDESLQIFSSNRTFDLGDLFFGILGIILFTTGASYMRRVHKKSC